MDGLRAAELAELAKRACAGFAILETLFSQDSPTRRMSAGIEMLDVAG